MAMAPVLYIVTGILALICVICIPLMVYVMRKRGVGPWKDTEATSTTKDAGEQSQQTNEEKAKRPKFGNGVTADVDRLHLPPFFNKKSSSRPQPVGEHSVDFDEDGTITEITTNVDTGCIPNINISEHEDNQDIKGHQSRYGQSVRPHHHHHHDQIHMVTPHDQMNVNTNNGHGHGTMGTAVTVGTVEQLNGQKMSTNSVNGMGTISKVNSMSSVIGIHSNGSNQYNFESKEESKTIPVVVESNSNNTKFVEIKNLHRELKFGELIDKGFFGRVYKADWKGDCVAVKMFKVGSTPAMNRMNSLLIQSHGNMMDRNSSRRLSLSTLHLELFDDERYNDLMNELLLIANLKPHPNIVQIQAICRSPICTVMEYMGGGNVRDLVYGKTDKADPMPEEKLYILVEACLGLKHLITQGIVHRDIAARNILLSEFGDRVDENTKVKITDFGISREHNDEDTDDGFNTKTVRVNAVQYKWMAPESIRHKVYNEKSDIYMFGSTIWEIMYGEEPWADFDAVKVSMNVCLGDNSKRPGFSSELEFDLEKVITKCWDKDPGKRPTFKEVFKMLETKHRIMDSNLKEMKELDSILEAEHLEQQKQRKLYEERHDYELQDDDAESAMEKRKRNSHFDSEVTYD